MVANTLAELATAVPKAGGPYVYVRRAFGDYLGFVSGWGDYAIYVLADAYLAIAASEFLAEQWPALRGRERALATASRSRRSASASASYTDPASCATFAVSVTSRMAQMTPFQAPVPQQLSDEDILAALKRIPVQCQEVIVLCDVEELTYKEIAEALAKLRRNTSAYEDSSFS